MLLKCGGTSGNEYAEKLGALNSDIEETQKAHEAAHQKSLASLEHAFKGESVRILEEIQRHKVDVEKLVGVIGNLGVTSGYQKAANHARSMLYVWQGLTISALGFLMFIAFMLAFPSHSSSQDTGLAPQAFQTTGSSTSSKSTASEVAAALPQVSAVTDSEFYRGLATRVFLSMTCVVFAAYAARQARHFLAIEAKNRKLALELEALGPYIAPLSKEAQDEFRVKLGERSFGVPDPHDPKPIGEDPVSIGGAIKPRMVGEYLAEIIKGFKSK